MPLTAPQKLVQELEREQRERDALRKKYKNCKRKLAKSENDNIKLSKTLKKQIKEIKGIHCRKCIIVIDSCFSELKNQILSRKQRQLKLVHSDKQDQQKKQKDAASQLRDPTA